MQNNEKDPRRLLDFGRTEVLGIYSHNNFAALTVCPDLIDALSRPATGRQRLTRPRR